MKILLIGGAGFIGTATAAALLGAGHSVRIADSFDPQIHGADYHTSPAYLRLEEHCEIQAGDVRDRAALERTLEDIEAVYFFAAGTGTGQSMYQVHRYCDVNVLGTAVFAELLPQFRDQVRKVIVSSSRAVYGEGAYRCATHGRIRPAGRTAERLRERRWDVLCPHCAAPAETLASEEDDAWAPTSIYGITKLAQEQILLQTCANFAIPAVLFRYQNVYGPGQSLKNPYTGILAIFSQVLARGEEVNIFEDGLPTRDFVQIDDVVHYNLRALTAEAPEPLVLNVGSGVRTTLLELLAALAAALGVEPRHRISGDFRAGDIRHACADLRRLTATLGPREFTTIQEGVRGLVAWILEQGGDGLSTTAYRSSLDEMRRAGMMGAQR